jgi:hypothetical protein
MIHLLSDRLKSISSLREAREEKREKKREIPGIMERFAGIMSW